MGKQVMSADPEGQDRNPVYVLALASSVFFLSMLHGGLLIILGASSATNPWLADIYYLRNLISGQSIPQSSRLVNIIFICLTILLVALAIMIYRKLLRTVRRWRVERSIVNRFSSRTGTAGWADITDMQRLCGNDGLIVGYRPEWLRHLLRQEIRFSYKASCEHTAVIGPTGCGKTTTFFIPNLMRARKGHSIVVTDPKGELAAITAQGLRSRGWDTCVLDLDSDEYGYNPLAIARNLEELSDIAATTLINGFSAYGQTSDSQWLAFARPYWEAAILTEMQCASLEKRIPMINNAYNFMLWGHEQQVALIAEQNAQPPYGNAAMRRFNIFMQSAESPETIASIRSVAATALQLFGREDIVRLTSAREFIEPASLRGKPTVLYLRMPEHKAALLKPLISSLFWQLFNHLVEIEGLPVFFFLDEFANIGKIPGFAQLAATMRSRQISISICLQGIEQLAREYSPEEQKDILNNMKTKIYYPGSTGEAGQYFSVQAGQSTLRLHDTDHHMDLMRPDELRRIPDNHAVIMAHNINPMMVRTVPYFNNRRLKRTRHTA